MAGCYFGKGTETITLKRETELIPKEKNENK